MEKWKHLDEQQQVYAAVITDGDNDVGSILDVLKETGVENNTIMLFSFTDEARTPFKERKGLTFKSSDGDYIGTGLYAAVSYDEGKSWPDRRLIAPVGKTTSDINGYLSVTQTRDGRVQLITSKDHYTFNLAWLKALPPAPKK